MIQPNAATSRAPRRTASGVVLVLAACGGGEETVGEETGREIGQGETTREVRVVGRYPLPGRPPLAQGIAYGEGTGDFFVDSAAVQPLMDGGDKTDIYQGRPGQRHDQRRGRRIGRQYQLRQGPGCRHRRPERRRREQLRESIADESAVTGHR